MSDNNSSGVTPLGAAMSLLALGSIIVGLVYILRWMLTTKLGAIVGSILAVVVLVAYLTGHLDDPATKASAVQSAPHIATSTQPLRDKNGITIPTMEMGTIPATGNAPKPVCISVINSMIVPCTPTKQ